VSDFDQRHTVKVYASYRFTDTLNLSGQWRYGSGLPIPGFIEQVGANFFITTDRNLARLPAYSHADVRVSKAFLFNKWKLTIHGEVLNLLNRENVRFTGLEGIGFNNQAFIGLDKLLRILPSGGIAIEF
jgi:hypothetical protein